MRVVHTIIAAAMVFTTVLTAAGTPVYLKAGATGDGSGSSWANACSNLPQAVAAAQASSSPIYAAGGVYRLTATVTAFDGLEIDGGFPGVSEAETLANRDVEQYQTILTGAKDNTSTWVYRKYDPAVNAYDFTNTDTGEAVLKDGKVNLPTQFDGPYDGYYVSFRNYWNGYGITVPKSTAAVVDGIWFVALNAGVIINSGAKSSTVRNCRIVGMNEHGVIDDAADIPQYFDNCQFLYIRAGGYGTGISSRGPAIITGCTFISCSHTTSGSFGNVIFCFNGLRHVITDCTFARCAQITAAGSGESGGLGNIVGDYECGAVLTRCVISNNLTTATGILGAPLLGVRSGAVTDCLFYGNRSVVRPISARAYTMVGSIRAEVGYRLIEGCTFVSNVIDAASVDMVSGAYSLGIVGNVGIGTKVGVVNSTFEGNSATGVENKEISIVRSRGILTVSQNSSVASEYGIANCTFRGADDGVHYDLAQVGLAHPSLTRIFNCVFDASRPFYADVPAKCLVRDCTVPAVTDLPAGLDIDGLETDAWSYEPVAASAGRTLYRPAGFFPGARKTVDIATNGTSQAAATFRYRLRGDTTWAGLVPSAQTVIQSEPFGPAIDALGTARPLGSQTRGAVQSLPETAEDGVTIIVRVLPTGSGTVTPLVQTAAPGGTPTSLTAANATTFQQWELIDGTALSTDATWQPPAVDASPTEKTIVYIARYVPPPVDITFDLDGAGRFTETQSSICTIPATPGTTFPAVPAFTVSEGWLLTGWSPTLPAAVPFEATTYTAQIVSTALRVVRVVPPGTAPEGSDDSGSSWANATDDLAAALSMASVYRGELHLKRGVYYVPVSLTAKSSVAFLGGYLGSDDDDDARDLSEDAAIITGDQSGNNYWTASPAMTAKPPVWTDGVFNEPDFDIATVNYWWPNGNNSDDTAVFMAGSAVTTNFVFRNITFTCFRERVFELGEDVDMTLDSCRILANNTSAAAVQKGVLHTAGAVMAENCDFIGQFGAVWLAGADDGLTNTFRNCRFLWNGGTCQAVFSARSKRVFVFERCRMAGCFDNNYTAYMDGGLGVTDSVFARLSDSLFEGNRFVTHSLGLLRITVPALVERCIFRDNLRESPTFNAEARSGVALVSADVTFRDCSFTNNKSTGTGTTDFKAASVLAVTIGRPALVNCTLEGNSIAVGTSIGYGGTIVVSDYYGHLTLVNCTLNGNAVTSRQNAEIIMLGHQNVDTTLSIVNTVMDGGAVFLPVVTTVPVSPIIVSSLIRNYSDAPYKTGSNGFRTNIVDATGQLSPKTHAKEGVVHRGLSGSSAYCRLGVPVWTAPNRTPHIYSPAANAAKPWISLLTKTPVASVSGLTTDSATLPDALGSARGLRDSTPGPLVAAPQTLLLLR